MDNDELGGSDELAGSDEPVGTAGSRPTVVITTSIDPLNRALGIGTCDAGEKLSAETVRRLACDADILPAVLGTRGEVLDLGRRARTYTGAARRALILRDGGCAFPHCDRPPRWCHGHHIRHWIDGGETTLANGVLLCGYHHRIVHHTSWTVRIAGDGFPEFIPPADIDPLRRPQRNRYHRRH